MRCPNVGTLLAGMEREQVEWWEAFDAVEPIGVNRMYELLADLGTAIYGAQGHALDRERFLPWTPRIERAAAGGDCELAAVRAAVALMAGV